MKKYQPSQFEPKLIEVWDKENTYATAEPSKNKQKTYILDMFPYPSGAGLHVGHPRGYTATDILSRYYRMKGYSVLHPMGWDAFGLPAENAAIKAKKNPMDMVPDNIANFKRQMKALGLSFDWSREFSTTDPSYYKWTQWLFIQFYKLGLLYKKNTEVYYCEKCKTGLAEEEVLANGIHERCGCPITKKELPQWIFKITSYADRLLEGLDDLDWPKGILDMQKNWIGRKEGINITYKVVCPESKIQDLRSKIFDEITCFTTRPDTNFGATFVVLAPEHEFVKKVLKDENTPREYSTKIKEYVDRTVSKTDLERIAEGKKKTGVFTGYYAVNNLNNKLLPIWVSDFVLSNFGTGAVVGVPGHDLRDFEFAREFGLEIVRVVVGKDGDTSAITESKQVQEEVGRMINSEFLNGLDIQVAKQKIMDYLEEKKWGQRTVSYHLRDWIFSRQRYWGEPIPMVYCQKCADKKISWWDTEEFQISNVKCQMRDHSVSKLDKEVQESLYGWFPIDEKSLPLELPYLKSYEPSQTGESPLSAVKDWVKTTCPHCGGEGKRETDTMPNWAGSCWYFLRFADPHNDKEAWSQESMKKWQPVDWYVGGAEHAVLHLLYSRFWVKALYDLKLVDFSEPFLRLRNVGMVLAEDHRKMSKSLGNVINPDEVVKEYGADTLRIYEMFMAPFSQEISWSTSTLQGGYRFLNRVWNLCQTKVGTGRDLSLQLNQKLNKTVHKVTNDILNIKFNTAIASMMEFINDWEKSEGMSQEEVKKFLKILAPFAPFTAEEIWRDIFGEKSSIHLSPWPEAEKMVEEEEITIPVQVNGKVRGTVVINREEQEESVVKKALEDNKVKKFVEGKSYKTIYVKGKILNFIVT
ncbi:MAG: leucine--tRNA ligase [Candidatus Roizmanbacteria bacterium]|nr:MAG: leucine--tRNA ligase [Candidatus Roizmanbacteria bacterium]